MRRWLEGLNRLQGAQAKETIKLLKSSLVTLVTPLSKPLMPDCKWLKIMPYSSLLWLPQSFVVAAQCASLACTYKARLWLRQVKLVLRVVFSRCKCSRCKCSKWGMHRLAKRHLFNLWWLNRIKIRSQVNSELLVCLH